MTDTRVREVRTFSDIVSLSEAAAREIAGIARESIAARGRFTIALSGGNTPKRTYGLLVDQHRDEIDWSRWEFVFGDERFVPPDDSRSNYRMAREALFDRAPIPAARRNSLRLHRPLLGFISQQDLPRARLARGRAAGAGAPSRRCWLPADRC